MIEEARFKKLLDEYNIDYENLKRKSYLMRYQELEKIEKTLFYLIEIKKVNIKSIEKYPSVLSINFDVLKENYEFLEQENDAILRIKTCLHILGTDPTNLKKTYFYIK